MTRVLRNQVRGAAVSSPAASVTDQCSVNVKRLGELHKRPYILFAQTLPIATAVRSVVGQKPTSIRETARSALPQRTDITSLIVSRLSFLICFA
jgi:hypothetical protein